MKKNFLLAPLLLLLAACQTMTFDSSDDDGKGNNETTATRLMHFRLSGLSMTSFEELTEDKDVVANAASARQNGTDHILFAIYDKDGNAVDTVTYQDKDDASYGTFSRTLKYGTYTIIALGWNGSQQCNIERPDSIFFNEGWVPHTFLCRQNIIVNGTYSDTRTLSMKRCVSRFVINFEDKNRPQEIKDFVVTFIGAGNALNSETRLCPQRQDFSRTVISNIDPSKITSLTTYCFLPEESTTIDINVVAHDSQGKVVGERKFNDVPVRINYSTNYSGTFFPFDSATGSVTFEQDFDGEITGTF